MHGHSSSLETCLHVSEYVCSDAFVVLDPQLITIAFAQDSTFPLSSSFFNFFPKHHSKFVPIFELNFFTGRHVRNQ